jgi:transcriptional antiterminator NusG
MMSVDDDKPENSDLPASPAEPAPEDLADAAKAEQGGAAVAVEVPPAKSSPQEDGVTTAGEGGQKFWYVVKVQSGREESIKEAIERRVKIEGLQENFGRVVIPVERVTEMRKGKRVIKTRKLFPGYLMVNVEFNDRILYLFRETSGVGDFVGGGLNKPPQPMSEREVEKLLRDEEEIISEVVPKSKFDRGDKVKVKDGTFAGMEGEVKEVLEVKGALKVELTIFGRPVPVELEYWQVDYV